MYCLSLKYCFSFCVFISQWYEIRTLIVLGLHPIRNQKEKQGCGGFSFLLDVQLVFNLKVISQG